MAEAYPLMSDLASGKKNILLTGRPGVGKTTVIAEVLRGLKGVSASGFYTREIRPARVREGFEAITLGGQRAILAHVKSHSRYRVSKYGVELPEFEAAIVPAIEPELTEARVIVIDEIGKMECFSAKFREAVVRALDSDRVVLGTIGLGGDRFIRSLKGRDDVLLVRVTERNREALVERLRRALSEHLSAVGEASQPVPCR